MVDPSHPLGCLQTTLPSKVATRVIAPVDPYGLQSAPFLLICYVSKYRVTISLFLLQMNLQIF